MKLQIQSETFIVKSKNLSFRLIEIEDAEFILTLRNNPLLGKFLSNTSSELSTQIKWISDYKLREKNLREFYFIIENKSSRDLLGCVRIYNLKDESFEWGSWILKPNSSSTYALECALLIYWFGFWCLGFENSEFEVRKENQRVINFHRLFGAKIVGEDDKNFYFLINKEKAEKMINKYSSLKDYELISV